MWVPVRPGHRDLAPRRPAVTHHQPRMGTAVRSDSGGRFLWPGGTRASHPIHLNHVVRVEESGIDDVFVIPVTLRADVGVQQQLAWRGQVCVHGCGWSR